MVAPSDKPQFEDRKSALPAEGRGTTPEAQEASSFGRRSPSELAHLGAPRNHSLTHDSVSVLQERLASKIDEVRAAADRGGYSPEKAAQTVGVLSDLIKAVPEKSKEALIRTAIEPLLEHNAEDVLKLLLSTSGPQRALQYCRKLPFMVDDAVKTFAKHIAETRPSELTAMHILPISNRLIVAELDAGAMPHAEKALSLLTQASEIINKSSLRDKGEAPLLTQMRRVVVFYDAEGASNQLGTANSAITTLVLKAELSPLTVASTLVHEDAHLLFEKQYSGLFRIGPDGEKPLAGHVPWVDEHAPTISVLTDEMFAYMQNIFFELDAVRSSKGQLCTPDLSRMAREFLKELPHAVSHLEAGLLEQDQNEPAKELIRDLLKRVKPAKQAAAMLTIGGLLNL